MFGRASEEYGVVVEGMVGHPHAICDSPFPDTTVLAF